MRDLRKIRRLKARIGGHSWGSTNIADCSIENSVASLGRHAFNNLSCMKSFYQVYSFESDEIEGYWTR